MQGQNMFKLLGTKLAPNQDMYILIAAACMIPTVWLPDLKALSVLGVFGFAATLVVSATICYVYLSKRCPSTIPHLDKTLFTEVKFFVVEAMLKSIYLQANSTWRHEGHVGHIWICQMLCTTFKKSIIWSVLSQIVIIAPTETVIVNNVDISNSTPHSFTCLSICICICSCVCLVVMICRLAYLFI